MNQHPSSTDLLVEVERLRQSEANLAAQIRKMTEEHNYDNKRLKDKINSLLNCVNEGKLLQQQVTYLQNNILTAEKEKNEAIFKMQNVISLSAKQDAEIKDLQQKNSGLLVTKTDLENQLKVWIDKCCAITMEKGNLNEPTNENKNMVNGHANLNDYQVKCAQQKQTIIELENELKRKNVDIDYKEHRISQILGHIDLLEKEKESFMKEKERFTRNVKLEELENLQIMVNEKNIQCDQLRSAFYKLQEQYKVFDTKYCELEKIKQKYKETTENQAFEINQQLNEIENLKEKIVIFENKTKEKDKDLEEMSHQLKKFHNLFNDKKLLPNTHSLLDEMELNINKLSKLLGIDEFDNELKSNDPIDEEQNMNKINRNYDEKSVKLQKTQSTIAEMVKKYETGNIKNSSTSDLVSDDQKSKILKLENEVENLIEKLLESENKNISLEISLEKMRASIYDYEESYNNHLEANGIKQIYNSNSSQTNNYEEIKKPSHIPSYIWEKINLDKNLCLFLKHQQERLEHLETENDSMHEVYQLFFRKLRDDFSQKNNNGKSIISEDMITEILQNNIVPKTNNTNEEGNLFQRENQDNENVFSINECFNGAGKIIEL